MGSDNIYPNSLYTSFKIPSIKNFYPGLYLGFPQVNACRNAEVQLL